MIAMTVRSSTSVNAEWRNLMGGREFMLNSFSAKVPKMGAMTTENLSKKL
jgi:hypothetical protein